MICSVVKRLLQILASECGRLFNAYGERKV